MVPYTAVAHIQEDLADAALRMMKTNMQAQIAGSPAEALEAAFACAATGAGAARRL